MTKFSIYADNAATSALYNGADGDFRDLISFFGNPSGVHTASKAAFEALCDARSRIALLLGCEPEEIIFTSGGTEADNQAVISAAHGGERFGRKHLLIGATEHPAISKPIGRLCEREGFTADSIPVDENGFVTPEAVEARIRKDTSFVSVMYANNEIGTVSPIKDIAGLCRKRGLIFHTDAVQAVGKLKIDVRAENIDMLSASAHKFGGPKGFGFLFADSSVYIEPLLLGGGQENGRRAGTENVIGAVMTANALEISLKNAEKFREHIRKSAGIITERLIAAGGILCGDRIKRIPGNICFCFDGINGEALAFLLDEHGICASAGAACHSGKAEPSLVLKAIGRSDSEALGALRISLNEKISEEDAVHIADEISECVCILRKLT